MCRSSRSVQWILKVAMKFTDRCDQTICPSLYVINNGTRVEVKLVPVLSGNERGTLVRSALGGNVDCGTSKIVMQESSSNVSNGNVNQRQGRENKRKMGPYGCWPMTLE